MLYHRITTETDLVSCNNISRAIPESKGMYVIFQKKGKKKSKKVLKRAKKATFLKISAKMYKIWKYFEKGRWSRSIISHNELLEKILISHFDFILCIITKGIWSSTVKMSSPQQNALMYQKNQEIAWQITNKIDSSYLTFHFLIKSQTIKFESQYLQNPFSA